MFSNKNIPITDCKINKFKTNKEAIRKPYFFKGYHIELNKTKFSSNGKKYLLSYTNLKHMGPKFT